jgi:hypothetical protein
MRAGIGSSGEMERHLKLLHNSDPLRLDDGTVDRILHGMSPDDAPRAYRGVAAMFRELTAAPTAAERAGERQAVTAIIRRLHETAASPPPEPRSQMNRKRRFQVAGATLVGSAVLFAGLGAAGALPGAAQNVASDVLATVGVSTPSGSPDTHAGTHPDERGRSGGAAADDATTTETGGIAGTGGADATGGTSGKGSTVSSLAQDPSTTGVEKGAAVASEASNDQSEADEPGGGPPEGVEAGPPASLPAPPVVTPNPGGTGTGDTASDGNSDTGTDTAGNASDGRSTAGSGNADTGLDNQP